MAEERPKTLADEDILTLHTDKASPSERAQDEDTEDVDVDADDADADPVDPS